MYHHSFDGEEMDFGGFGEKPNLGMVSEGMPAIYFKDEQTELGVQGNASSAAIPINNGRSTAHQANLSGSQDSEESAFHPGAMHEMPSFNTYIENVPNETMGGNSAPRYTVGPGIPYGGGFMGHRPQDPYPSPVIRPGQTNVRPSMLGAPQHDHLNMMYGQSCPEAGAYHPHRMHPNAVNPMTMMVSPHGSGYPASMAQSPPMAPTGLSASLFQFRTNHPVSPEQIVEKQKKRKESHNAVERRRRDHINEMIHLLGGLVDEGDGESIRLNKGEVLQKAVERIRYLERVVEIQREHINSIDPTFTLPEIEIEAARSQDA